MARVPRMPGIGGRNVAPHQSGYGAIQMHIIELQSIIINRI